MTDANTKPDLTLLRDPAAIWPDPMDCPDWPLLAGGERKSLRPTREEAEGALANHIEALHGAGATLRPPTKGETEAAIARYFQVREPGTGGGSSGRFDALGYQGLRKALSDTWGHSSRIIESTHIRGYLRKLDAEEEQANSIRVRRDEGQLKARVSRYTSIRGERLAELDKLKEAEERHLQMLADQRAHARCVEVRRQLRIGYADAKAAANDLGIDVPDLPELRYDD